MRVCVCACAYVREKYALGIKKKKNRKQVESKRITEVLTIIIKINIIGRKSIYIYIYACRSSNNNNIIIFGLR